uniref:Suppressor APC domain containing 1 n=1 Tax=Terrapene triunguis TaxID=2587831 RepID=A0A674IR84_9SAUR
STSPHSPPTAGERTQVSWLPAPSALTTSPHSPPRARERTQASGLPAPSRGENPDVWASRPTLTPVSPQLQRRQARERERDALLQGLELAERLRGWYRRHLLEAQRRQEQAGAEPDYFPDSCPNQSCLLLAKIQEVNLGLRNLLASPGKADPPPCFPSSRFGGPVFQMGKQQEFQQQAVNVLKEQNRLLIKEVSEKSDRIAQLEQEKAALCRQLQ